MFASTATESLSETHRRPYETVAAPDQVPLYDLVSVKGPEGEPLDAYHGVRRRDTSAVVSVVSSRYQLVQHREVAGAVHTIGEGLDEEVDVAEAGVVAQTGLGRSLVPPGRDPRSRGSDTGSTEDPVGWFVRPPPASEPTRTAHSESTACDIGTAQGGAGRGI